MGARESVPFREYSPVWPHCCAIQKVLICSFDLCVNIVVLRPQKRSKRTIYFIWWIESMRLIWRVHENRCHFASIHLFDSVSVPFERYWSDLFVRRLILLCCDRKNGRECVASELIDPCEFYTSLPCCLRILLSTLQWNTLEILFYVFVLLFCQYSMFWYTVEFHSVVYCF